MIEIRNRLIELNEIICKSDKIALINHRKMDWDAYWSILWFKLILEKLWKDVVCIWDDMKTPAYLDFIYPEEIISSNPRELKEFKPDLIISLDAASREQLWDLYIDNLKVFEETFFVVIDHHPFNQWFWNIDIIDRDACSTCEIVCEFIKENCYEDLICEDVATALMLWIITDTNSFVNVNTTPDSLRCASVMLSHWARHQEIIEELFKKTPFARTQLWANALFNIKNINWTVIWAKMTQEMFKQSWATLDDTSGFVDSNLTPIDWSKIIFVLYELPDWKIKWSFRSKDDKYNMNEFCSHFWGGWHVRASWFTIDGFTLEQIEEKVINLLKEKYDLI